MDIQLKNTVVDTVKSMLGDTDRGDIYSHCSDQGQITGKRIKGDGSDRRFIRILVNTQPVAIAILPGDKEEKSVLEARAGYSIGLHLQACEVPVPKIFDFDDEYSLLLCEDLGECHLHSEVIRTDFTNHEDVQRIRRLYRDVVTQLLHMQLEGSKGFVDDWCWDTPKYDRELMLERESGYFCRAYVKGTLGLDLADDHLQSEFDRLANIASELPANYFLHRDFQSRNIMIKDDHVRFIDYQGGRKGPLGYDLASLLIDPYAKLPAWFQEEIFSYYFDLLRERIAINRELFTRSYNALALQRNLQIVGAFSYLSGVAGKKFFAQFIDPAVCSLRDRLINCSEFELPRLLALLQDATGTGKQQ